MAGQRETGGIVFAILLQPILHTCDGRFYLLVRQSGLKKSDDGIGTGYRFQRTLALKVLKPHASEGSGLALFEQEAQLLGAITHPNVVQIFDHGRDEATGLFYYTMTLVRGPSLRELSIERGGLDVETAVEVFQGVLAGLSEIHALNVVHRDITPRNILVEPEGNRAVVMDLGIAREVEEEDTDGTVYTRVIAGTPMYMSPEQSAGHRPTKASDIFSLGLTSTSRSPARPSTTPATRSNSRRACFR